VEEKNIHLSSHAPKRWHDYLMYPRVLFTCILCLLALILHVAYGVYVVFFEK